MFFQFMLRFRHGILKIKTRAFFFVSLGFVFARIQHIYIHPACSGTTDRPPGSPAGFYILKSLESSAVIVRECIFPQSRVLKM